MNESEQKLEKKLSPINVWALALGSIIGWGAFVMPGTTFLPKGGTLGTAIGMGFAAIIMIIIALNYGYMVEKYPIAGGEYTFTDNTFGKKHAFFCGWFLGLSYLAIVPLNATALALVSRKLFGGILRIGYLYTIAGWDVYIGEILLASAALILFAYLSVKGISIAGWVQTVMAFVIVACVVLLLVASLLSPMTDFSNLQPATPNNSNMFAAIVSIVAVAPWAFVGFDSIPQAAEEFNFSHKKTTMIMILSILFGGFVYIVINTITASVLPWEILLEKGYDWPTGEVTEMMLGKIGLIFLGAALICAVLSGIIGFYMASSRLLFSVARDGALPDWFGKLDSKYNTPKNAILFVMGISLLAPWFGREVLTWIVDMSSIGAAIGYAYTSAATYITLKQHSEDKKPLLKLTSIVGTIISIVFVLLLVVPGMPSYLVFESRMCLLAWSILGLIFAIITKRSKK